MKTVIRISIIIVFLVFQFKVQAQEERLVHDEHLEYQIKWTYGGYPVSRDSLSPFFWYWATHNEYYYGSQPNVPQLEWAKTYTQWTDYNSQKQEKAMDTIYKEQLVKDVYNTIDIAYLLEQRQFERKIDTFYYYNNKIKHLDLEASEDIANRMEDIFLESYEKVKAIKGSYIENHKRQEAYIDYEEEMDQTIVCTRKLYQMLKLCENSPFEH